MKKLVAEITYFVLHIIKKRCQEKNIINDKIAVIYTAN